MWILALVCTCSVFQSSSGIRTSTRLNDSVYSNEDCRRRDTWVWKLAQSIYATEPDLRSNSPPLDRKFNIVPFRHRAIRNQFNSDAVNKALWSSDTSEGQGKAWSVVLAVHRLPADAVLRTTPAVVRRGRVEGRGVASPPRLLLALPVFWRASSACWRGWRQEKETMAIRVTWTQPMSQSTVCCSIRTFIAHPRTTSPPAGITAREVITWG